FLFEGRYTYDSVKRLPHFSQTARWPFSLESPGGGLQNLEPEAKTAGLAKGDSTITVDGRAVRGMAALARELDAHHSGDVIQVTAMRGDVPVAATVQLGHDTVAPAQWALIVLLNYVTPWFSIALGFTVLFLRPRDPLAWLLLLLLLSFSAVAQSR